MNPNYFSPNKSTPSQQLQSPQPNYRPITREDYPFLISPMSSPTQKNEGNIENYSSSNFSTPAPSSIFNSSFNSSQFEASQYLSSLQKTHQIQLSSAKPNCKRLKKHAFMEQNQCSICLSQIQSKVTLACSHYYCLSCLQQWIKNSTTCPYCRTQFTQYTYEGEIRVVESKEFEYHPSNDQVMDWLCYNCDQTQEGDIVIICDRCEAHACHVECDESLGGIQPIGMWICHFCRQ